MRNAANKSGGENQDTHFKCNNLIFKKNHAAHEIM
jgi:hypothetical protein